MSDVISFIFENTSSADVIKSIFLLGQNCVQNVLCAKEYDKITKKAATKYSNFLNLA